MIVVYFLYCIPESSTTLFCKIRWQIFQIGLHTFPLSLFYSLIFAHIPLTSLSPAINILHVRLDESEGFSRFMEKKEEKMGEVSIDRWGVNGKREGGKLWAFAGV